MANKPGVKKAKRSFNWQGIIMNEKQDYNRNKITLKFLKAKLRSIGEPEIPVTLKAKLFNATPRKANRNCSKPSFNQRFGIWGFSASAAIVVILVLIIILNFGPSIHSSGSYDGMNNYPNDLNAPFIEDINSAWSRKGWPGSSLRGLANDNLLRFNLERAGVILTVDRQVLTE